MKILCVHGVGDHHSDTTWQADWSAVIRAGIRRFDPNREVAVEFVMYDDIFEKKKYRIQPWDLATAVTKLTVSGIIHGIGDFFRRGRGLGDLTARIRWTAGMIVQWADEPDLRKETRARVIKRVGEFKPDVVAAHSLGSLVCYDTFARDPAVIRGRQFVSLGSQIGNAFVRNAFGGRIKPLSNCDFWYHLFNRHDSVFTAQVRIDSSNFAQVSTDFDLPGPGDHSAISYLSHPNAQDRVWREICGVPQLVTTRSFVGIRAKARKPQRRALLVGINDYPNPEDRLEGCVNDVFTMSSVLQETGFAPDDIRVVLNERATARGILDRLDWLLDEVADDDDDWRFFYYSGHGAQIPMYGQGDDVDHIDECLVPHDFDWTHDRAITDDQFFDLYSQLPYKARFYAVLDCCHSGGMTRAGGAKIRGLAPPDDIRHRALKWNPTLEMWEQRNLEEANREIAITGREKLDGYVGEKRWTHRIGRAIPLRHNTPAAYKNLKREIGHEGPFMPVILQACDEGQLSYEYRHGVESHGAFTYSLKRILRNMREDGKGRRKAKVTLLNLKAAITEDLAKLGYEQTPCLVGPTARLKENLPWVLTPFKPRLVTHSR